MTMARILKSRMTRKCHVRFGSGGGVGDRPAHHNLGRPPASTRSYLPHTYRIRESPIRCGYNSDIIVVVGFPIIPYPLLFFLNKLLLFDGQRI